MRYFTSDLHFRHPFVAALRGYAREGIDDGSFRRAMEAHDGSALADLVDWERHDRDILDNIRSRVGEDDELYVLGDISSGGKNSLDTAIEDLKSLKMPRKRMHLILGNHEDIDAGRTKTERYLEVFGEVSRTGAVSIGKTNLVLSHFQFVEDFGTGRHEGMAENSGSERLVGYALHDDGRTLLLHGHTHANTPFEFGNPREMNVGLDAWDMRPVSEDEVVSAFDLDDEELKRRMSSRDFRDVLDSFLHGAYRDKTASLKVRKGEYDKAYNDIIGDDSMGPNEKARLLEVLNNDYSKTVQVFDENGEDEWCERSYDKVLGSAVKKFGNDPEFLRPSVDTDSMALTADVVGNNGSGTIRVRMVPPTKRMSAHVVVTAKVG